VAVLVGPDTFSGGEGLAFDLQEQGRATVVGQRTKGGAHPRIGVTVHPHLELTLPIARSVSVSTGENWEGKGIRPDVEVPAEEALDAALARLIESLG
jgi:C-terminal processing protease CtpA/Prc